MISGTELAQAIRKVLGQGTAYDEKTLRQALDVVLSHRDTERLIFLETITRSRPTNVLVAVLVRLETACRPDRDLAQEIMTASRAASVAFKPPRANVDPDVFAVQEIDRHRSESGLRGRIDHCFELAAEDRYDAVFILPYSINLPKEQRDILHGYVRSQRVVPVSVDEGF